MIKLFKQSLHLALALAIIGTTSFAHASSREELRTTLAGINFEKNDDYVYIFADRLDQMLRISVKETAKVRELMEARNNGWEVSLVIDFSETTPTIVDFEILSRSNHLTTGLNRPDVNFRPLIANSMNEINRFFRSIYPYDSDHYDVEDNCFNRAQYWARSIQLMQENSGTTFGTDKVFIFFTQAYIKKFDHKWWYHVAPMVYLDHGRGEQAWVFDSTFLSRPAPLKGPNGWLAAFDGHTNGQCEAINSLDEYYRRNHEAKCFYIVASMFNYSPSDLRGRSRMTNWRCNDFRSLITSIPAPYSKTTRPGARWSDPENAAIVPQMCR